MNYKELIDYNRIPQHVAIIMDGNGRWAKKRLQNRVLGHTEGIKTVRNITETAAQIGISFLTLYTFSTENWQRPATEVNAIMDLLVRTISAEAPTLNKNNVRLKAIGNLQELPNNCYEQLLKAIEITQHNTKLTLTLALNYSARWELLQAFKQVATHANNGTLKPEQITEQLISNQYLTTNFMPDPELLIRTSGEYRISNYLLWQIAYTELYFTPKLWPEFSSNDLYEAVYTYQQRDRRFGGVKE